METSVEEYRAQIVKAVEKINSIIRLRRLYTVAHCMMLRDTGRIDQLEQERWTIVMDREQKAEKEVVQDAKSIIG